MTEGQEVVWCLDQQQNIAISSAYLSGSHLELG
jgi:hypothetical protein